MAIHYILTSAKNPSTQAIGKRAMVKRHYLVEEEALIQRLIDGTTVSEEDAAAVLVRLRKIVQEEVLRGNSVKLPGLGTFQAQLMSGFIAPDAEFNPTTGIKGLVVRFRSAQELRNVLRGAKFAPYEIPTV